MDAHYDRQIRDTRRRFGLSESGTLAEAFVARDKAKTCAMGTLAVPLTGPGNASLRPNAASTAPLTACSVSFSVPCPGPVTMSGMVSSMESLIMECPEMMRVSEPVVMPVPAPVESGTLAEVFVARDKAKTCATGTLMVPLTRPGKPFLRPKAASTAPLMACSTSFFVPSPEPVTMRGIEMSTESLMMECPKTMCVSESVLMPVPVPVMTAVPKFMPAPAPDLMSAEVPKLKASSVVMRASAGVAMPPTVSFEQFLTPLERVRRG